MHYFSVFFEMAEKQDNINKNRELLAKQGDFRHVKEMDNSDKNTFHLPRQEVAFLEKVRKSEGCGSLKRDFYTRFKQKNVDLGCDMAEESVK